MATIFGRRLGWPVLRNFGWTAGVSPAKAGATWPYHLAWRPAPRRQKKGRPKAGQRPTPRWGGHVVPGHSLRKSIPASQCCLSRVSSCQVISRFFTRTISRIGQDVESENAEAERYTSVRADRRGLREQIGARVSHALREVLPFSAI